jgi:hypothetical protein
MTKCVSGYSGQSYYCGPAQKKKHGGIWRNLTKALKVQLVFENVVQSVTILASVAVVGLIVGTHDGSDSSLDRIREWPKVQLVQSLIVNIRRQLFSVMLLLILLSLAF